MLGGEGVVDVPMVAWEQAAIVTLFAVVFIVLIRYLLSWFSRQQAEWQRFISERDREWREWMASSNRAEQDTMERIAEALTRLSGEVAENNHLLIKHDAKVNDRVEAVVKRRRPSTGTLSES